MNLHINHQDTNTNCVININLGLIACLKSAGVVNHIDSFDRLSVNVLHVFGYMSTDKET